MLKRTKPVVVTPVSTESMVDSMVKRFDTDIAELEAQKESTLSVFRNTAVRLQNINNKLNNCIADYDKVLNYVMAKKSAVQKSLADNEAVRSKIIGIIGE